MGQYHFVCNLDRKEYLHPHRFGDGLKLLEFGSCYAAGGTLTGLAILLSEQNGRGGGDLHGDLDDTRASYLMENYVGRWAGDRIAIIGDYFTSDDKVASQGNPWRDEDEWDDISEPVVQTMIIDPFINQEFAEHRAGRFGAVEI